MYKKFSLGLLVAALFLFARPAAAVTVSELQAQIQALMAQIVALQQGGDTGTSISNSTFRLVTPNGGDRWQLNSQHAITWQPDPQSASTTAYLEKKTGSGFKTVGKIIPVGKGSIIWDGEVGASGSYPRPGKYFVRLENLITGESDRSDKSFSLLKPGALVGAKIQKINGEVPDEELHGGRAAVVSASDTEVSVTWTSKSGVERCSLTVYNASGTSGSVFIDGLPASGTETIALPGGEEGEYYIQHVTCYRDDGSGTGYDNIGDDFVYLIIGEGTGDADELEVVSPNKGETFGKGESMTYQWWNHAQKPVDLYMVQWSSGDVVARLGRFLVAKNIPWQAAKSTQQYEGYAGMTDGGSYRTGSFLMEVCLAGTSECDRGEKPFTVKDYSTDDSITIINPNGGESFVAGNTTVITWDKRFDGKDGRVSIVLESDCALKTSGIIAADTGNTGEYLWNIPLAYASETCGYKVLISTIPGTTDHLVSDRSDGWFSIKNLTTGTPSIRIISPNGGEVWKTGETHTIFWDSMNLEEEERLGIALLSQCSEGFVIVHGTPDYGGTPNDGSYTWTIPNGAANDKCGYKLNITALRRDGGTSDQSDSWFSVPSQSVPYYKAVLGANTSYEDILSQMAGILRGMQEVLGEME